MGFGILLACQQAQNADCPRIAVPRGFSPPLLFAKTKKTFFLPLTVCFFFVPPTRLHNDETPTMKFFDPLYNSIPKTELHVHLEGAIRTQTIVDVAKEHNLKLPSYDAKELDKTVKIYEQLHDLDAVLEAFAIFQDSIVSPAVFERIGWEFFEDSAKQNVKLLEVRFSPDWAFSGHNVDWDLALEGLIRAKTKAEKEFDMIIGFITITTRSMGVESCEKTVDWSIKHKEHILAVDLAGSEKHFPIRDFVAPVLRAKAAGLKVTIHTGEDTPASFVRDTIEAVQPDRIGHGIHCIQDPSVVELVKQHNITLEVNPWSNYLTNAVATIEEHPLKQLFDCGVKVTISSDDPEVLETNLNNEYRIAHEILGMSFDEIFECNKQAFASSFLPAEAKTRIWDKYFADYKMPLVVAKKGWYLHKFNLCKQKKSNSPGAAS